jgi:hypothetical protein
LWLFRQEFLWQFVWYGSPWWHEKVKSAWNRVRLETAGDRGFSLPPIANRSR